jgi:hypothetical protein
MVQYMLLVLPLYLPESLGAGHQLTCDDEVPHWINGSTGMELRRYVQSKSPELASMPLLNLLLHHWDCLSIHPLPMGIGDTSRQVPSKSQEYLNPRSE